MADVGAPAATAGIGEQRLALLFTDIEGSTRLLERLAGAYGDVLAAHADIVRGLLTRHGGREVDTQGDAFFLVFADPVDALAFAADLQRALAAHPWPGEAPLRLRIGIHVGTVRRTRTGYVGLPVHHAARIGGAAHGGQVLASAEVAEEAAGRLPAGAALRSLGAFHLKDIREAVELLQLEIDGLPTDHPPPRTLDAHDEPPTPGDPPYPGLVPFEEADAARFFGREALVAELTGRLLERRFLAIVGGSGSGKSSVLRAGLAPTLRLAAADAPGSVGLLTPGEQPLAALDATLAETGALPSALAVDQFEELFTMCRDEAAREAFLDRLLGLLDQGTAIVLTLRADFYDRLAAHERLRSLAAAEQVYLGPLAPAELRSAIEGPAAAGGWRFDPGLVDLILHDVGREPGALPLLSHALRETWERRRGTLMTLRGYLDAGRVQGAIARTADQLVGGLRGAELATTRAIFLRLTELGDETADSRRRASLDELLRDSADPAAARSVLDRLVAARLVVADGHTAEVAHEALIREWPQLREWLDQDRDAIRLHRSITDAAADWERSGRDPSLLFRGARLAAATEWHIGHPHEANALERTFLAASSDLETQEAAEREAARQRELDAARRATDAERARADTQARSARRIRRAAGALVGLLVVALVLAGFAFVQVERGDRATEDARDQAAVAEARAREAQEQSRVALGRQLVAQSQASRSRLDRSLLLALEGLERDPSGEAWDNLVAALATAPEVMTHRVPVDGAGALAASPDGTLVAVVGRTEEGDWLRVHRTDDWSLVHGPIPASVNHSILNGYGPYGENLAFDAAGERLAYATPDALGILDLSSGMTAVVPGTQYATLDSVAWRSSDRHLAYISRYEFESDPVLHVVEPGSMADRTSTLTPTFDVPAGARPYPGFLSPGGRWVIVSDGAHAQVFDGDTGVPLAQLPAGETTVLGFAPDGDAVVMASERGLVVRTLPDLEPVGLPVSMQPAPFWAEPDLDTGVLRAWVDGRSMVVHELESGRQLVSGQATEGSVVKVAPSDALRFVARQGAADSFIEVVDPARAARLTIGEPVPIDPGDGEERRSLISPDGSAVAMWVHPVDAPTRSVLVRDVDGAGVLEQIRPREPSGIAEVALSSDGRALITLHDSGRLLRTERSDGSARSLGAYAPLDGSQGGLVVGPEDRALLLGEQVTFLESEGTRVVPVQAWKGDFLPDGSAVVVSDCDTGRVHLIDVAAAAVSAEASLGGCPWAVDVAPAGDRVLVRMDSDRGLVQILSLPDLVPMGSIEIRGDLSSPRFEDRTGGATLIGIGEGLVRWVVDPVAWRALACATAGRNLTVMEWSRAAPGEPYRPTCEAYPPGADAAGADPSVQPVSSPGSGITAPSVSPSAPPGAAASPADVLCQTDMAICWQPPGRATARSLDPPVSMAFDGMWYVRGFEFDRTPDSLTLVRDPGMTLDLISGISTMIDADSAPVEIEPTTDAFMAHLRSRPDLDVTEPSTVSLVGRPAVTADVTPAMDTALLTYPSGATYVLAAGQRVRLIVATLDDRLFIVAVEAPEAEFDRFWEESAEPFVDSITLEPMSTR